MKKLLFLYLAVCSLAFSQAVRVDPTPVMTTATNVPPGAMAPVLAIPGATVHVCEYPANGAPCTNYATTYTDPTETTACPTNAQLVLAGTTACVATTDQQGNYGFWVDPGALYTYTVTLRTGPTFGPYTFSPIAPGTSNVVNYNEGSTGAVTRTVQSRLRDTISVKDFGATGDGTTDDTAAIQAAVNSVCADGGKLFMPGGIYAVSSTILFPQGCNGIVFEGAGSMSSVGSVFKWIGAANGTVVHIVGSEWDAFYNFAVNGEGIAGQGIWLEANNASHSGGSSSQKNVFQNITVEDCGGSPGYGLAVYGLADDDVSQNLFQAIDLSGSVYNLYQNGIQTLGNVFNMVTSYRAGLYGAYFNEGDVNLFNGTFLVLPQAAEHSLTQKAHVYFGHLVSKSYLEDNDYECLKGLNPAIFSNYFAEDGSGILGNFTFQGEKINWGVTGGGKVMNYTHASVLDLNNITVFTNTPGATPGEWYVSNSVGTISVPLRISGGTYDTGESSFSLHNVSATIDSSQVIVQGGVIEGTDGVVTSGSATFTSASGPFSSGMVGWGCFIGKFNTSTAGSNQTISAVGSSTSITLGANAANSATGVYYRCGRNINAGAGNVTTSSPSTLDTSTVVSDGGNPRFWLRRNASDGTRQNWGFVANSSGANISVFNGDNPTTATGSPFINFTQSAGAASGVSVNVPLRIGSVSNPALSYYFEDFTGQTSQTLPTLTSVSFSLTIPAGQTATPADGCLAFGGSAVPGLLVSCLVSATNTVEVTYFNGGAGGITIGGPWTIRVVVFHNS